jgi:hypothetical protein
LLFSFLKAQHNTTQHNTTQHNTTQQKHKTKVSTKTYLTSHHTMSMNIDPPPPSILLARQQSDESYAPLPLPVLVKKNQLPRTPTSKPSISLSSLSLTNNIDQVLTILSKDDDDDDDYESLRSSPTSTMHTITTATAVLSGDYYKKHDDCFGMLPISFTTDDDDNETTPRSSSILVTTANTREKHVRFSPYCQVKDTLSHKDYTPQEKYNTYLQYDESKKIQQREYLLISKMESLLKQSYKLASYQEVFIEQERQEEYQEYEYQCNEYHEGSPSSSSPSSPYCSYDDQAIANAYSTISIDCRIRAQQVALKNRQEVELYL